MNRSPQLPQVDHSVRPPVELHRLISSTVKNPELVVRLRQEMAAVLTEFSVPAAQQEMLKRDPKAALDELNVHPNLRFKFLAALGLLGLKGASIQPYLKEARGHGKNR